MLQYLIVCSLVFLAELMDSIAGDGGLVASPAYLVARVPAHVALGTSKLNSAMGTTVSTARLAKHGFLKGKVLMAVCFSAAVLMDSALGAHLALMVPKSVIKRMMIVVLSVVAFYMLRSKGMGTGDRTKDISRNKVFAISIAAAFFTGGYSGLYGPETGTLLILILIGAVGMNARSTSAQTKIINLSSNIAALVAFIATGNVYYPSGLTVDVCFITGHYIRAGTVARDDQKVIRPVVLMVFGVLFIKVVSNI